MNTDNRIDATNNNEARQPYQTPKLTNLGPIQAIILAARCGFGDGSAQGDGGAFS